MRALVSIQRSVGSRLGFIHSRRLELFWFAVAALLGGQRLSLTWLGRSANGRVAPKHRIKRIDRLLGNSHLHREIIWLYAALAQALIAPRSRPVVLVDWTDAGDGYQALVAALPVEGRAIPIYAEVHPECDAGKARVENRFLRQLERVLPRMCVPVIVTDAGFRNRWFDSVHKLGWDFVGRIRHNVWVKTAQDGSIRVRELFAKVGKKRMLDLGTCTLTKTKPREYRLVLFGTRARTKAYTYREGIRRKRARRAAQEPWLLATSLDNDATRVVDCYRWRMKIEEAFRDLKSHRFGWSFEDARSRSAQRIAVLLLIAAYATTATILVALSVSPVMARRFQANTVTHRRVLSLVSLGQLVLREGCPSPPIASFRHLRAHTFSLEAA